MTKSHTKTLGFTTLGISQRKKIDDCQNVYSVNPLYLSIDHVNGYIEEKRLNPLYLNIDHASGYNKEKDINKYLVFDSKNKELLKIYNDVWNGIKSKIKEVDDSEFDYEKDYMEIKFNSDDNLPLNKPQKFHLMTITIRPVFEEDGKLCPQLFLDDALDGVLYIFKKIFFGTYKNE